MKHTELTRREECLHHDIEDGEVTFGIFFSTQTEDDEAVLDALHRWVNTDEDVSLNFRFTIRDCINNVVDFRRYVAEEGIVMETADKPMIDALRAELAEQLARLDAIKFQD